MTEILRARRYLIPYQYFEWTALQYPLSIYPSTRILTWESFFVKYLNEDLEEF
jgi:hypothetical protein